MPNKTAYIWGTVSTFTAPLVAWLLAKGWHVHIACKSALNVFSLSPLDLPASARDALEVVLGGRNHFKAFQGKLRFLENGEIARDTTYDALIFCGLPPNFDDARVPRAVWAAAELPAIAKSMKGVPIFMISSLWGGIQPDGVVPEDLEFERRKARHHWERICQNYELKLIQGLSKIESNWYFIRLPLLTAATADGYSFSFSGLANLFAALDPQSQIAPPDQSIKNSQSPITAGQSVSLAYQPDATLWFMPVDTAVYLFWRFLEDNLRPRICNLVSTQITLNREWLQYLAPALSLKEIISANQKDGLNLPLVLRKLLLDDVQVKTRNLFEVVGRYQLRPDKIDQNYFAKVIEAGRRKNWGRRQIVSAPAIEFSTELARYYFEQFLPAHLNGNLLYKMAANNISIGFKFKDADNSGWLLKTEKAANGNDEKGKIFVSVLHETDKPKICFRLTGDIMIRLMQNHLSLHRALLMKKIEIDGPWLDALRVSDTLSHFMKEHPLRNKNVRYRKYG